MRFRGILRRLGGDATRASAEGGVLEFGDGWSRAVFDIPWEDAAQVRILRDALRWDLGARPYESSIWRDTVQHLEHKQNRKAYAALSSMLDALAEAVPHAESATATSGAGTFGTGASGAGMSVNVADGRPVLVSRENTVCAVNTIWAAAQLQGTEAAASIGRILERAVTEPWTMDSVRIRNAGAKSLAAIGTKEAVDLLAATARHAPTKAQQEQLLLCLDVAARGSEQPPSRLAELHMTLHGLDADGRRVLAVRRHRFELRLLPDGRVTADDLSAQATPDEAASRVAATEGRALRAAYRRELARVEALLATDRTWLFGEWRRLYLENPVTRAVAHRLVWRLNLGDGGTTDVLPTWDGEIRAVDGRVARDSWPDEGAPASAVVSLWHPREAEPAMLAAWREVADALAIDQPFQQIERDFTRAEPGPETVEINQYAPTSVGAAQLNAALRRLDWHSRRTRAGAKADAIRLAYRDFPDDQVSIAVPCRESADVVVLGSAWFHRSADRARSPLPLDAVSPRVYSEAVRDLAMLTRDHGDYQLLEDEVSDSVD